MQYRPKEAIEETTIV